MIQLVRTFPGFRDMAKVDGQSKRFYESILDQIYVIFSFSFSLTFNSPISQNACIDVYLFKKAQILAYHLYILFRTQDAARFDFADIDSLTIFSDNVVPTMLAHLGVIRIPDQIARRVAAHEDLGTADATRLRAAAVVACEEITRATRGESMVGPVKNMKEVDLDVYLWRLGKVGAYREVTRFELRDTVYF